MTNTTETLFVVIRPAGSLDRSEAYATTLPEASDPVEVARELARDPGLFLDGTEIGWRTVAARDAGAARLLWPRPTKAQGGSFVL